MTRVIHINSIERVQRHFTKRITELHDFSYREHLSILNLDTLEYRRLSCDLTSYYKICCCCCYFNHTLRSAEGGMWYCYGQFQHANSTMSTVAVSTETNICREHIDNQCWQIASSTVTKQLFRAFDRWRHTHYYHVQTNTDFLIKKCVFAYENVVKLECNAIAM